MTTWADDAAAALDALGDSPTPTEARAVTDRYPNVDVLAAIASRGGGGGGFAPVSCVIARDAATAIRTVGDHAILWDALYDNYSDFNTLDDIPDGLGLDFAFDGSSAEITTTTAGVWAFSYTGIVLQADNAWQGSFDTRFGAEAPQVSPGVGDSILPAVTLALPSGVTFGPRFSTSTQATEPTYACANVYLIATRLG